MNLAPKKSFNESQARRFLHEAVATDWFAAGATAALVEMQFTLNNPPDMGTAASWHWRMEGARQFLGILMNLTEARPEKPQAVAQNLTHKL